MGSKVDENEIIIVGAGLCGLTIARSLKTRVTVLEKSRGLGGRIATRRTTDGNFDHGAQFYKLKPTIEPLHQLWVQAGLVTPWLDEESPVRFASPTGMTALAKHLAHGIDVQLEKKVLKLQRADNLWRVEVENVKTSTAESLTASIVLLTCPLPQSLEILRASGLSYDKDLETVLYAKALVGLFEGVSSELSLPSGYSENVSETIFSISDQSRKGLAKVPSWTVVMQPKFSHDNFDESDEASLLKVVDEVGKADSRFRSQTSQLKKWRYSHPLTTYKSLHLQTAPGLFLCGDAFGGPSLNGAAASAYAVLKEIGNS